MPKHTHTHEYVMNKIKKGLTQLGSGLVIVTSKIWKILWKKICNLYSLYIIIFFLLLWTSYFLDDHIYVIIIYILRIFSLCITRLIYISNQHHNNRNHVIILFSIFSNNDRHGWAANPFYLKILASKECWLKWWVCKWNMNFLTALFSEFSFIDSYIWMMASCHLQFHTNSYIFL